MKTLGQAGQAYCESPLNNLAREDVNGWSSRQFTDALRHDQKKPAFNPSFRQLLHVSFKVAAKKGDRYLNALKNTKP